MATVEELEARVEQLAEYLEQVTQLGLEEQLAQSKFSRGVIRRLRILIWILAVAAVGNIAGAALAIMSLRQ